MVRTVGASVVHFDLHGEHGFSGRGPQGGTVHERDHEARVVIGGSVQTGGGVRCEWFAESNRRAGRIMWRGRSRVVWLLPNEATVLHAQRRESLLFHDG